MPGLIDSDSEDMEPISINRNAFDSRVRGSVAKATHRFRRGEKTLTPIVNQKLIGYTWVITVGIRVTRAGEPVVKPTSFLVLGGGPVNKAGRGRAATLWTMEWRRLACTRARAGATGSWS